MSKKRQIKTAIKEITTIDKNTGEVLEEKTQTAAWSNEPDFVKLYLEDVGKIINLPKTSNATLLALLRKMNYDNEIVLAKTIKEELAEMLKLKINTLEHAIGILVTKNVLIKKGNNVYLVNPYLIGKGQWKNIKEIRLHIKYSTEGRQMYSESNTQLSLELP